MPQPLLKNGLPNIHFGKKKTQDEEEAPMQGKTQHSGSEGLLGASYLCAYPCNSEEAT